MSFLRRGFFCQSANKVAILGTYLQFRSKMRAFDQQILQSAYCRCDKINSDDFLRFAERLPLRLRFSSVILSYSDNIQKKNKQENLRGSKGDRMQLRKSLRNNEYCLFRRIDGEKDRFRTLLAEKLVFSIGTVNRRSALLRRSSSKCTFKRSKYLVQKKEKKREVAISLLLTHFRTYRTYTRIYSRHAVNNPHVSAIYRHRYVSHTLPCT